MSRYFVVRQIDATDCGPACLATIALQNNLRIPLHRIRDKAGTDIRGTNLSGLANAARKLGFEALAVRAKEKKLTPDSVPFPLVAHQLFEDRDHYVVVHKVTAKRVLVADPGEGLKWYSWEKFCANWTGNLLLLAPRPQFENQESEKKVGLFERFWKVLLPYKRLLVEIFIASFLLSVLGLVSTFYSRILIDTVLPSQNLSALTGLSIAFGFIIIFQILLGTFRSQITMHLANKVDVSLILHYFKHILSLPLKFFESRKTGEILNRIGDTYTVRNTLYSTIIGTILDVIMILVAFVGLFFYDFSLIITAMIPFCLSIIVIYIFVRPYREFQKEKFKLDSEKESQFYESISGISTIKAMGAEQEVLQAVEDKFLKTVVYGMKMGTYGNFQGTVLSFISAFGGLAVFWLGSFFILSGRLSLGEIISFNTFIGMFLGPLGRIINLQASLQGAKLAADRLGEVLDMDTEADQDKGSLTTPNLTGKVQFSNVTFAYGSRGPVFKNLSFEINAGERVGIVGATGSGKSTIVKLMMKFYLPEEGRIFLDGRNLADIETSSLRTQIGYVPQEVLMFSGTMKDNLTISKPNATIEEIESAVALACADEFINKMPEKYQTKVSERGTSLSGGERQRLALARALIRNPNLFIFDEATSNLDALTESTIQKTINEVCAGKTTIIIAHRLATIRNCDRIFVLGDGMLLESGSHAELLKLKGKYEELWRLQMGVVKSNLK